MKRFISIALLLLLIITAQVSIADNPQVLMETSQGSFILELNPEKAPLTVANFLDYVESGHYEGTIFHRVIPNLMIQAGGYTADYTKKSTGPAIINEANNRLRNGRGTIAMARGASPNSAKAQFFINVLDNGKLNYYAPTHQGWGYAVFGKVIEGMDVIDQIRDIPTGKGGPFSSDVPQTKVIITKTTLIEKTGN